VRYTRDLKVLRLGHVLLTVKDTQRSYDFYTGILGFRLSDWVYIDDNIRLCFLRCNERHHSLAFAPCMPGKTPRLQHAMFEVESLDDVMRSYHFLRVHRHQFAWDLAGIPTIRPCMFTRRRPAALP
jgi:catechol 2,3-dioxygenase-like lactoylglutathione lyase family enzyme